MAEDENEMNTKGLDQIIKAMKKNPPQLKIGVLGGGRNAQIGAVHEFGSLARNIPQRSFLRIPLSDHLNNELERSGLLELETLKEVIKQGSMLPWMKQVAIAAESVVDDAFQTKGYGQWRAWEDTNYHNQGGTLLVDTGQLRESITSEVIE